MVKGKLAGKRHRYRVLSSSGPQAGEATLLAPSVEAGGGLTCAPAPQGSLRILEGPHESPSGTLLQTIPASPQPQIPPGLRPRFCPFGGSPPVTGPGSALALGSPASGKRKKKHKPKASFPQEAMNGHGTLEVDAGLGSPKMDVGRKRKKQQLKEPEVMELVAAEPTAEMLEPLGVLFPSTSKKKKKSRQTEMVEPEVGMLEPEEKTVELELMVKTEPLEETVLSPTKKRKRQKGKEGTEPVEGMRAEPQLQVKMEPQEEDIPLPSLKKKKREKGHKVLMEPATEAIEPEMRPLELRGEMMESELPLEAQLQAEAAPASTKKRRKKDKWQNPTTEPKTEVVEPQEEAMVPKLPGDPDPQVSLASTKKKKERGHKATEPGTEMINLQGEIMEPELPDEGETKAKADPASTKRRKKRGQDCWVPETASQEKPELPLNPESGEVAPTGREEKKKKKKKLQQDPV